MLAVLGLSSTAEAVYMRLAGRSQSRSVELAEALGLKEDEISAALAELAELSLVRPSREDPASVRAVSVSVALTKLIRDQEAQLAQTIQELAAMRAAVVEAAASLGLAYDHTERLIGIDAIETKLEILAQEVKDECLAVLPGGAQSQASLNASRPLDEEALRRGITLCNLYQDTMRYDEPTRTYAEWLVEQGGQVRTAPVLPPRMLIFDRRVAVVPMDPDNSLAGALITREPGIVATLVATYQLAWTAAVPYSRGQNMHEDHGLTEIQHKLLTLLAQGMTDEAVAKRLGIGLRTVRRQMSAIMDRLGAQSRFEAGMKVARNSWL
ncbi:LuxR C-terminal-related transcriptional regulator [Streptomyces sp. NPDC047841]|uniref:LuxR C-terminal-related transcriptional regulator n=1 Tax=Streptomyces sp. NPDC047841 TaxID=3154708 RepID=UPI0034518C8C